MNPTELCEMESNPTLAYHAMILEETNALFSSDWNQVTRSTPVVNRSISSMDVKVFKAAREGNIDALREHSVHLHQLLTATKSTVLHVYIASVGGATLTESADQLLKSAEVVRDMLRMCRRLLLQANQSGDTALHLAARHGRADIVEALVQAAKEWHGDLEEGISSTELCCEFLIRKSNKEKNTALHEAVRFDHHLDVVKILTREDPHFLYSANNAGETPLYIAAERRYQKLVFEILDTCANPASYQGPYGLTALHFAAIYGDEQRTRRLLEKEMTLTVTADSKGRTPLHAAALMGHVAVAKQILECDKCSAYSGDIDRRTPVHYAAVGSVNVLKQLFDYCPDSFELLDDLDRNALHHAIMRNQYEVEEFVGQDPWLSSVLMNGKDSEGNTPLHEIALSEEYHGLKFISDGRVDKMAFNNENHNALDIILKFRTDSQWKRKMYTGLKNSGAKVGQRQPIDNDDSRELDEIENKVAKDSEYKEIKESHLVVSTLIATVTFAAGFTVPGGYQSDKGPDQGLAVLSGNARSFQGIRNNKYIGHEYVQLCCHDTLFSIVEKAAIYL